MEKNENKEEKKVENNNNNNKSYFNCRSMLFVYEFNK